MEMKAVEKRIRGLTAKTLGAFVLFVGYGHLAVGQSPVHGPFPYVLDADNTRIKVNRPGNKVPFEAIQDGKAYRGVVDIREADPMRITSETSRSGEKSFVFTSPAQTQSPRPHYEIDLTNTFSAERGDKIKIGEERYFGFSFRFDGQAFPTPETVGFNIMQVRMGNCISPVRMLVSTDGEIKYVGAGGSRNTKVLAPLEHDVWFDVVVGWKYDPFKPRGFHRVWFKKSEDSEYQYWSVENHGVGCDSSWSDEKKIGTLQGVRVGMYCQPEGVVHRMFYDEVRYSDNFAEAAAGHQISEGKFDFGAAKSPVEPGYTRIDAKSNGYGLPGAPHWSGSVKTVVRRADSALDRDLHFSGSKRTFSVSVPNGVYRVTVNQGDTSAHDNMRIAAEGEVVADNITRGASEWAAETFEVTVEDGVLDLEFSDAGGADANWVVNSLAFEPLDASEAEPE